MSVIQSKRVRPVMNEPCKETVRILMHQIPDAMGQPKLDYNQ
jgi:hypothetical protein